METFDLDTPGDVNGGNEIPARAVIEVYKLQKNVRATKCLSTHCDRLSGCLGVYLVGNLKLLQGYLKGRERGPISHLLSVELFGMQKRRIIWLRLQWASTDRTIGAEETARSSVQRSVSLPFAAKRFC